MTSLPPDTDHVFVLVERIQAGVDYERSCGELFRLFRRRVNGFFALRGFPPDECADLTQETFIRVFNGIGGLHSGARFARWLFEIAANLYRNELRRQGAAKRDAPEESIEGLVEGDGERRSDTHLALRSKGPSPLDGALGRERLETLRCKLRQLPPQMRRCLYLRLYHDFKYREIAVLMKISIETVKAHLHQAQKRLVMLSDQPSEEDT